ncbi:MAG: ABC transporter ATP-binding protein/permease [Deltaproteobacteria bacterium]|nr:ABC transporter ATP-binding protein/permease [Deltaproteobacteria bacterium]
MSTLIFGFSRFEMTALNRKAWKRLYRLASPFFYSDVAWKARGMLGLLLALSVSIKAFDVVMSYIGRDFMTALSLREQDKFMTNLYYYLLAFSVAIPLSVLYRFTEERLALMWRRWFTLHTLDKYFANRAYYRLGWYKTVDNPDQRIEEDIRSFTSTSLSLFLITLQSCIALFAFAGVLSSISWTLTVTAIGYAVVGSIVTYFLGRPLINLNFEQLRREADYRYKLIKVRDNSESIAFYRGEAKEKTRVRQRLKDVVRNMLRIIHRNLKVNFFTTGYNYLVIILPTIVVAPLYLRGEIEFGVVTQSAVAFSHVLNALSIIVTNFGSLSAYAAVVRRLGVFTEVLEEAAAPKAAPCAEEGEKVSLSHVTILTPDTSRTLVSDLSIEVPSGGLLICGPSGCGKSSVLRVLSGLWDASSGRVIRPPFLESMYVPQRPYLVIGSLRSQLLYTETRSGFTSAELLKVLRDVDLESMFDRVGGFDATVDWSATLSNGEQQRIGLARLMLVRPKYVFLDEATTAIDEKGEQKIYDQIRQFAKIIVSVGYRSNLQRYHESVLELHGDGTWHTEKGGA